MLTTGLSFSLPESVSAAGTFVPWDVRAINSAFSRVESEWGWVCLVPSHVGMCRRGGAHNRRWYLAGTICTICDLGVWVGLVCVLSWSYTISLLFFFELLAR